MVDSGRFTRREVMSGISKQLKKTAGISFVSPDTRFDSTQISDAVLGLNRSPADFSEVLSNLKGMRESAKELIESSKSPEEIVSNLTEQWKRGDKVRWKDFRERFLSAIDKGALSERDNVWTVLGPSQQGTQPEVYITRDSQNKTPKTKFSVPHSRLEKI